MWEGQISVGISKKKNYKNNISNLGETFLSGFGKKQYLFYLFFNSIY